MIIVVLVCSMMKLGLMFATSRDLSKTLWTGSWKEFFNQTSHWWRGVWLPIKQTLYPPSSSKMNLAKLLDWLRFCLNIFKMCSVCSDYKYQNKVKWQIKLILKVFLRDVHRLLLGNFAEWWRWAANWHRVTAGKGEFLLRIPMMLKCWNKKTVEKNKFCIL